MINTLSDNKTNKSLMDYYGTSYEEIEKSIKEAVDYAAANYPDAFREIDREDMVRYFIDIACTSPGIEEYISSICDLLDINSARKMRAFFWYIRIYKLKQKEDTASLCQLIKGILAGYALTNSLDGFDDMLEKYSKGK